MDDKPELVKTVEQWCTIDRSFVSTRFGTALLWFIVVFIIMIVVLYVIQPQIVKKKDETGAVKDEVDFIKVFMGATIIGIIVGIIGFIIRGKCKCN